MAGDKVITLLPISQTAWDDIAARIERLGPEYESLFQAHRQHGVVIVLDGSEVGLVIDKRLPNALTPMIRRATIQG